jgi:hypothetical protein
MVLENHEKKYSLDESVPEVLSLRHDFAPQLLIIYPLSVEVFAVLKKYVLVSTGWISDISE